MPADQPPLQSSTQPAFTVGGQLQSAMARDVTLVRIEEDIDGLSRLEARFIALGPADSGESQRINWLDGRVLDFGKALRVGMGPSTAQVDLFDGKVSALELSLDAGRAPELSCLAEDSLMDLRMTRRFKTYEQLSDADLVQQIAAQHGLGAQADVDGPTYAMVQQWNQSDLAFLRERARRLGADVWVAQGTLHMATRDRRQGPRLTLIQGNTLLQVTLSADLAHQRSEVKVGGYDDERAEAIDEDASATVVAAEAQGHAHGIDVLQRAFGERPSHRVRDVPLKGEEGRALAKAALLARARRFVRAVGIADGNTELRVGTVLKLERVTPLFEGDGYYVTRVRHQFDLSNGYRTHFEAERAWIGQGG
jgi:phage protein D